MVLSISAALSRHLALDPSEPATLVLLVMAAVLVSLLVFLVTRHVLAVRAHRQRVAEEEQEVASFNEALMRSQAPVSELARAAGLPRELLILRRELESGAP